MSLLQKRGGADFSVINVNTDDRVEFLRLNFCSGKNNVAEPYAHCTASTFNLFCHMVSILLNQALPLCFISENLSFITQKAYGSVHMEESQPVY